MGIKFAHDNRHLCCNCITSDYSMMIMLIDTDGPSILGVANFIYTVPFKIKDLDFYPNSVSRFVTCGIQHISYWHFAGGTLTSRALEIENPKEFLPDQQSVKGGRDENTQLVEGDDQFKEEEEEKEALKISFMSVIFVLETLITAGDDGFLYIWDDARITRKQRAHPDSPILALHTTKDSPLFASGGMDGKVVLWALT